ncbi:uncharacterized protein EV154DRAFT_465880 [Mucor mucedo]|uniref:Uncharacterized protein n=1 Tax=Mucor saturninus TaxID=64648 RepID=A0A8H7QLU4_9FUNG|nr:uncharacterized protein EV154DRAFT_465880 [Mucor mucedo]KAG2194652.1 hypothetical protein INT47_002336 [Mucor saturninus]KAI7890363.1 hypothetical protein EV154DRAFT_465880 [Mucor mucedo]
MLPLIVCPATCELCGNWLPEHKDSCPRDGVHPSQWSFASIDDDFLIADNDDDNEFAGQLLSQ